MEKGRRKAEKGHDCIGRGEKGKGKLVTRARRVPCRCGRAFYYRMHLNTKRPARRRTRYFHGICWMFLREAARCAVAILPHGGCTLCAQRHTSPSCSSRLSPSLSFLFSLFFMHDAPDTTLYSNLFFILAGEYNGRVPTGETIRRQLPRYSRAQTQRNSSDARESCQPGRKASLRRSTSAKVIMSRGLQDLKNTKSGIIYTRKLGLRFECERDY